MQVVVSTQRAWLDLLTCFPAAARPGSCRSTLFGLGRRAAEQTLKLLNGLLQSFPVSDLAAIAHPRDGNRDPMPRDAEIHCLPFTALKRPCSTAICKKASGVALSPRHHTHYTTMSLPKNASYTECMNYLTRPGALHETEDLVVDGRKITAFKNLPKTFRSFFLDKFGMYTDRTFLSAPAAGTDKRQYHTFAEIFDQSVALAAWLRAQGVERGDGVGIAGYNSPLWVTAFVATHLLGAVTVVLNASL